MVLKKIRLALRSVLLSLGLLTAVIFAVCPGPARANDKKGYEHAVTMAGLQRTLAQQIGKEAVLVALEIDKEKSHERLVSSKEMFQRISAGLRSGDTALGLNAITDPDLLRHVDRVEQLWTSVDQLLTKGLETGDLSGEEVIAVAELSEPLYSVVDELVKALRTEAQKRMVVFSINLLTIDYATRQSMLSQKMAKEFLLIAYGHSVDKNRRALAQSSKNFDRVLKGLLEGDLQLRLRQAPTADIRNKLEAAARIWRNTASIIESVAEGQPVTQSQISRISDLNLALLEVIDAATFMYEAL